MNISFVKIRKAMFGKIKEAAISVLPIMAIVLLISLTPIVDMSGMEIIVFCVSTLLLILGIALFNLGADLSMTPMGEQIGGGLAKTGKVKLLYSVCFLMGMLITVAEPDLSVLAGQVSAVMNGTVLIFAVGFGVGLFLLLAVLRVIYTRPLSAMLMFFYMLMFALAALLIEFGGGALLPLAFDSGGVTTGPVTVPFIMSLGIGIAATVGGKHADENSFGIVALCSVGPIVAVLALSLFSSGEIHYEIPDYAMAENIGSALIDVLLAKLADVSKALGLIVIVFLVLQFTLLKLPKKKLIQMGFGILYTFIGLVIFLSAVEIGYMPIGFKLGTQIAEANPVLMVGFSFVIGMVVVLAEPAIHVLNSQVESVTGGTVTKSSMMIALSVGVGLSIGLSAIRIIFGFSVLYYLIPGYLISLGLSFFVPRMYTAIAFDSGGVASGPLTSSFILPFMIGICYALNGEESILSGAFGVVAMVAMIPLITIQLLGFRAIFSTNMRSRMEMKRIFSADDAQIIYFEPKGD